MKMNEKNHSRLVCRAVRLWKTFSNSDAAESSSGHVAFCADCQRYFQRERELTRILKSESLPLRNLAGPVLEQRIIEAVRRAAREERPVERRFHLVPLAGVLASAALLAFILAPQIPLETQETKVRPTAMLKTITVQEAEKNLSNYFAPPAALLQRNPLQDEVDLVYSDAKSAWRFLELNFLPTSNEVSPARNRDV